MLGRCQQNLDVFQAAMLRDHEALLEQIPALGEAGSGLGGLGGLGGGDGLHCRLHGKNQ